MREPEGITPEIKMVIMEVPAEDIPPYEETNKGSGYFAFRIPVSVANNYELKYQTLYIDSGVFKLISF